MMEQHVEPKSCSPVLARRGYNVYRSLFGGSHRKLKSNTRTYEPHVVLVLNLTE